MNEENMEGNKNLVLVVNKNISQEEYDKLLHKMIILWTGEGDRAL